MSDLIKHRYQVDSDFEKDFPRDYYLDNGKRYPDRVIRGITDAHFERFRHGRNFAFDGFVRSQYQANDMLYKLLNLDYKILTLVLECPRPLCVERIKLRVGYMQANGFSVRPDDIDPEKVASRLDDYDEQLPRVLGVFSKKQQQVIAIDASQSRESVVQQVSTAEQRFFNPE